MTDRERSAAKTFEKVITGMTPAEKEKVLIFLEGMAFRAACERCNYDCNNKQTEKEILGGN